MNMIAPYPVIMDNVYLVALYLATSYVLGHYTIKTVKALYGWLF